MPYCTRLQPTADGSVRPAGQGGRALGSPVPCRSSFRKESPRCPHNIRLAHWAVGPASARAPTARRCQNRKTGWGRSRPRRLCGAAEAQPQVAPPFRFATNPGMTREMLFALALGYLLGSIPFGLVLTRLAGKGDIREI